MVKAQTFKKRQKNCPYCSGTNFKNQFNQVQHKTVVSLLSGLCEKSSEMLKNISSGYSKLSQKEYKSAMTKWN